MKKQAEIIHDFPPAIFSCPFFLFADILTAFYDIGVSLIAQFFLIASDIIILMSSTRRKEAFLHIRPYCKYSIATMTNDKHSKNTADQRKMLTLRG